MFRSSATNLHDLQDRQEPLTMLGALGACEGRVQEGGSEELSWAYEVSIGDTQG